MSSASEAQLAERRRRNPKAAGSTPATGPVFDANGEPFPRRLTSDERADIAGQLDGEDFIGDTWPTAWQGATVLAAFVIGFVAGVVV